MVSVLSVQGVADAIKKYVKSIITPTTPVETTTVPVDTSQIIGEEEVDVTTTSVANITTLKTTKATLIEKITTQVEVSTIGRERTTTETTRVPETETDAVTTGAVITETQISVTVKNLAFTTPTQATQILTPSTLSENPGAVSKLFEKRKIIDNLVQDILSDNRDENRTELRSPLFSNKLANAISRLEDSIWRSARFKPHHKFKYPTTTFSIQSTTTEGFRKIDIL